MGFNAERQNSPLRSYAEYPCRKRARETIIEVVKSDNLTKIEVVKSDNLGFFINHSET